jgi:hypothetical protein
MFQQQTQPLHLDTDRCSSRCCKGQASKLRIHPPDAQKPAITH